MRKFVVNVNGNSYEVEVEEVEGGVAPVAAPTPVAAPVVKAQPKKVAAPAPQAAPAPKGDGTKLVSPLPGTVLKFVAANGSTVKNNDVVLIVEAMKMENEIRANADGVVSYAVAQGASVNSGDVLAYIS